MGYYFTGGSGSEGTLGGLVGLADNIDLLKKHLKEVNYVLMILFALNINQIINLKKDILMELLVIVAN